MDEDINTQLINVGLKGKFRNEKEGYNLLFDLTPDMHDDFFHKLVLDAWIETKRIPHNTLMFGTSRPTVGYEGGQCPYLVPFLTRSQTARNFGNIRKTGYTKALQDENTIEAENRIENLDEFLTVAIEFEEEFVENTLSEFLEGITLSSDLDNMEETEESVTLMTLHSAKGLEFPVVFLVGMEEGIFPGYQSMMEPKELEEERRLCY